MSDEPAFAALDYPGPRVGTPTLLTPDGPRRLVAGADGHRDGLRLDPTDTRPVAGTVLAGESTDAVLTAYGEPPLARRLPVVAVGSNGSAAVLAHKLRTAEASRWLPLAPATISGVAVGHSAHISLRGYIAAAPYAAAGAVTGVVVAWCSPPQLAALDATEPNYRRVRLASADYPLAVLGTALVVPAYDLYESLHGVVALDGRIVPLATQEELHALVAADRRLAGLAPWTGEDVARSLRKADVRATFARMVRAHGYSRDSGLVVRE